MRWFFFSSFIRSEDLSVKKHPTSFEIFGSSDATLSLFFGFSAIVGVSVYFSISEPESTHTIASRIGYKKQPFFFFFGSRCCYQFGSITPVKHFTFHYYGRVFPPCLEKEFMNSLLKLWNATSCGRRVTPWVDEIGAWTVSNLVPSGKVASI